MATTVSVGTDRADQKGLAPALVVKWRGTPWRPIDETKPDLPMGFDQLDLPRRSEPRKVWMLLLQQVADQVCGDLDLGVGHAKSQY